MAEPRVVMVRGTLGWGNRKNGYEAYGPGGRWSKLDDGTPVPQRLGVDEQHGDLLGDALERAGANEGATLLVVAVPRLGDHELLLAATEDFVRGWATRDRGWAPDGPWADATGG